MKQQQNKIGFFQKLYLLIALPIMAWRLKRQLSKMAKIIEED